VEEISAGDVVITLNKIDHVMKMKKKAVGSSYDNCSTSFALFAHLGRCQAKTNIQVKTDQHVLASKRSVGLFYNKQILFSFPRDKRLNHAEGENVSYQSGCF